eukprot:8298436-Lingulodinium_polyedra.AAC.1
MMRSNRHVAATSARKPNTRALHALTKRRSAHGAATMRSNRSSAAATARGSHARARHARSNFRCTHGVRERAIREPLWRQTVDEAA